MLVSFSMFISEIRLPNGGFREVVLNQSPPASSSAFLSTPDSLVTVQPVVIKIEESLCNDLTLDQLVTLAFEWIDAIGARITLNGSKIEANIDEALFY